MSRNKQKGFFFNKQLTSKIDLKTNTNIFFVQSKNFILLPEYINQIFFVYNGQKFVKLTILPEMIHHKIGEFISTRQLHIYKKKKKKK